MIAIFDKDDYRAVTRGPIVYALLDADGVVVYVGQTTDWRRRYYGHRADSPWWTDVQSVGVLECVASPYARLLAERDWQNHYGPVYNVRQTRDWVLRFVSAEAGRAQVVSA